MRKGAPNCGHLVMRSSSLRTLRIGKIGQRRDRTPRWLLAGQRQPLVKGCANFGLFSFS
jgi:hypothetical protein